MALKKTSLKPFYARYVLKVLLVPVLALFIVLSLTLIGMASGILLPANYEEQLVFEVIPLLKDGEVKIEEVVPEGIEFAILDETGTEIMDQGTMSDKNISNMWRYLNGEKGVFGLGLGQSFFRQVEMEHAIYILHYEMILKFSNPILQTLFPYPWIWGIICFFMFTTGLILFLSGKVTNQIRNEVNKVLNGVEKISLQNLEFESATNQFKEFQAITDALDQLKDALQDSLKEQIQLEQAKSQQIGALAHDLKIPLTIIRGNTELLALTKLNQIQKAFADDIYSAALQIEDYSQTLIDVTKLSSVKPLTRDDKRLSRVLSELQTAFMLYIRNKKIEFIILNELDPKTKLFIDSNLFHRALINILHNAMEHGEKTTKITLRIFLNGNKELVIEIQDDGYGFSEEALNHGTELFYMKDKARSGKAHYGIGLNFASQVAELHQGVLTIKNTTEGGLVRFIFPPDTIL